jgi:uncharacterized protein YbbK (DUF523 family)
VLVYATRLVVLEGAIEGEMVVLVPETSVTGLQVPRVCAKLLLENPNNRIVSKNVWHVSMQNLRNSSRKSF